jgi:hypothetical protein
VPPIKTAEDALRLIRSLAEYYQRRLNQMHGVGVPAGRKGEHNLYDQLQTKIRRDSASEIARRLARGIEQGKHPAGKRYRKVKLVNGKKKEDKK